jgi:hypothetical protein
MIYLKYGKAYAYQNLNLKEMNISTLFAELVEE